MITGIINEEWRSISGYVNYQVSNIGRVRNATSGRTLKQHEAKGYMYVSLCQNSVGKKHRVHRLVGQEFLDNPNNKPMIDHIDRDTLNNTINNLRWVSNSQNSMNRRKLQNTSSKFKGVCFRESENRWHARIKLNGKVKSLGLFSCEKEAARKYNQAAIEHFGQHALLNEISSDESDNETEDVDDEETSITSNA